MGGSLNLKSKPGKGTSVTFEVQTTNYGVKNLESVSFRQNAEKLLPVPLTLAEIPGLEKTGIENHAI